jgi:hypothetical protein
MRKKIVRLTLGDPLACSPPTQRMSATERKERDHYGEGFV